MIISVIREGWNHYRIRMVLIPVLLIITGLTGGISVAAVIPLMSSVTAAGLRHSDNLFTHWFLSLFGWLHLTPHTPGILGFVLVIVTLRATLLILQTSLMKSVEIGLEGKKKQQALTALLHTELPFLYSRSFGRLTDVVVTQTRMISRLLNFISRAASASVDLAFAIAVVVLVSWKLSLFVTAFSLLVYLLIKPLFVTARRWGRIVADCQAQVQETVNQSLSGYRVVKSFSCESLMEHRLARVLARYRRTEIKLASAESALSSIFEPMVITIAILIYALFEFNVAIFTAFIIAATRMYLSLRNIQNMHYKILRHLAALDVYDQNFRELAAHQYPNEDVGRPFAQLHHAIVFHEVNYHYVSGQNITRIGPLNISIPAGNTVGFVGESGSGKSTTADLLVGLLRPESGRITIDGQDLSGLRMSDYRQKIGYVAQEPFILNDTIARNIDFRDTGLSDVQIRKACQLAHADKFIEGLPEGSQTVLGEAGARLSGGERQRIALARALAIEPDILILDEATSSLDNESERNIREAIDSLKGHITIIIIAHRLSTVRHAHRIFVFDEGQVKEEGSYDELLERQGLFWNMQQAVQK